jgi:hypothetical protein
VHMCISSNSSADGFYSSEYVFFKLVGYLSSINSDVL